MKPLTLTDIITIYHTNFMENKENNNNNMVIFIITIRNFTQMKLIICNIKKIHILYLFYTQLDKKGKLVLPHFLNLYFNNVVYFHLQT